MRFPKACKIETACAKESSRYDLTSVHLCIDGEGNERTAELWASDGRLAVIVPVEVDTSDAPGLLTAEQIQRARDKTQRRGTAHLIAGDTVIFDDTSAFPRVGRAGKKFPNLREFVPDFAGKKTVCFVFDTELLSRVADALGTRRISLEVELPDYCKNTKPYLVRPVRDPNMDALPAPDAVAVVMPVHP